LIVLVAIALHMFTDLGAALSQAGILQSVAAAEGWAFVGLILGAAVARILMRPSANKSP
jgi:hypothetical protein